MPLAVNQLIGFGAAGGSLVAFWDFTRATLAGVVGPTLVITRTTTRRDYDVLGILVEVASGAAQRGFKPSDGTPLGLALEGARTNLCLQSNVFKTTWSATNTTITDNAGNAADGTAIADDLLHTSSDGQNAQNITVASNTRHAFSVVIQSGSTGTHDFVHITYRDASNANGVELWSDLTNSGVISNAQTLGTGTTLTASGVQALPSGRFRIWIVGQLASGITAGQIIVQNSTTDGGSTAEETNSVIYSDAQLEAVTNNDAFPSSIIPTTTTSITRNGEKVQTTDMSWVNQSVMSAVVSLSQPFLKTNGFMWELSDNTGSNNYVHQWNSADKFVFNSSSAAGDNASIQGGNAIGDDVIMKGATGFQVGDVEHYRNGTLLGTDTTYDPPTASMVTLDIGHRDTDDFPLYGHIRDLRFYTVRLDGTTLDKLSTL